MPQQLSTFVKTAKNEFDNFYPLVKSFLQQDALDMIIDGIPIRGYRSPDSKSIWIRDHSDIMRGVKYFENDLKSAVEHFADTQSKNGRIFDFFTIFPEKLPSEKENWSKYVRVPVEADVEFRFVKAAFIAWQATGDDEWISRLLPHLEKALSYILTNPWRWDDRAQLVKRPYTIDTWDFAYTAGTYDWLQFQITDDTFWGIMHGDNSGYYQAFRLLALLYEHFDNDEKSHFWRQRAEGLKNRTNKICWNGKFYTHFVKLSPVTIADVDDSRQLSLSNPSDINRGVATHDMAVSIIQEYLERRERTNAFAEWFSIDPPFPDGIFGDDKLVKGAYVNGGIMPLVGGELAKAAFDHGYEWYGVDILKRYYEMISKTGETFLWYFPDGKPSSKETSTSPEATPTDGWGSSAMLYAFLEGLVGVEDQLKQFEKVRISPRWSVTDVEEAEVQVGYENSGRKISYHYKLERDQITLNVFSPNSKIDFHVLVPKGRAVTSVLREYDKVKFSTAQIEHSTYVNFSEKIVGTAKMKINFT